ncbi:hypothetical protein P692DRAFT_20755706, partial [Suillus brevipes Sb2]
MTIARCWRRNLLRLLPSATWSSKSLCFFHELRIDSILRSSFQQLAGAVQLRSVDSLTFSISPSPGNRPNSETHSDIKFWNKSEFLTWLESYEAQLANRGKPPYLEQENGDPVLDDEVDAIRKTLRGAFSELNNQGLAPARWGNLTASGTELMNGIMEKAHPIFRLANNGWKLHHLAMSSYPSWRRNHIENANENSKKRKTSCE